MPSYQAHPLASASPHVEFFYLREQVIFILERGFWQGTYASVIRNIFLSFLIKGFGGQELCSAAMCG